MRAFLFRGALFLCFLQLASLAEASYLVPGRANPWLSGMPDGTTADGGDIAPRESPTFVTGLGFRPGDILTFSARGGVRVGPAHPADPPDGRPNLSQDHRTGAEHGISDTVAPISSLLGVFLSDQRPDFTPAPASLGFRREDGTMDFLTLSPLLKQVFFIGDGVTLRGERQEFIVPAGATRLYLGTMDRYEWSNNLGSFTVDVNVASTVPEPSALLISLAAFPLGFYVRRRQRQSWGVQGDSL